MPGATTHSGRAWRTLLRATLFALAGTAVCQAEAPPMRVHFIDVGQGDATLFELPCNKTILVDTGGERNDEFDGRQAVLAYLDGFFDARPELNRTLSLLAITHPHRDHTQAVRAVLERYRVAGAVVSGKRSGSGWSWEESEEAGESDQLPQGQLVLLDQMSPERMRVIEFPRVEEVSAQTDGIIDPVDCRSEEGEGVDPQIRILWGEIDQDPGWGYKVYDGQKEYHFRNGNNHSLVLRVDYGKASFLLTGDLETAAIPDLLRRHGNQPGGLLDVDVYKVGHHGSANGTSEELLEAMTPEIAILSMGSDSRRGPWYRRFPYTAYQYGHPRKSVIQDLEGHVGHQRREAITRQVASGPKSFAPMDVTRCIIATGWGGSVVVTAHADGQVEVAPASGGASLCHNPLVTDAVAAAAESMAPPAAAETLSPPIEPKLLAPRPLCEASAALAAPGDEDLVLVADNERDEQLYVFEVDGDELVAEEVWQMPARQRPEDVEALAQLGQEVVVVGSHSRNRRCEADEDRQRLRRLSLRQDGTLQATTGVLDSERAWTRAMENGGAQCVATLFVQPAPAWAGQVCEAFVAAEREASSQSCKVLNIEGAFGTADGRLWLGLRSPLVDGRAVLLRLVPDLAEFRFDGVALLNLDGRGIRELALAGDRLFGLAGPPLDVDEPFLLFRVAASAVPGNGEPAVEILRRDLITSSEGLLVRGQRAFVLIDGEEGDEAGDPCEAPAGWYTVELPQ